MVEFTAAARRQIEELLLFYDDKGRYETAVNLERDVSLAVARIGSHPTKGRSAPAPYPGLTRHGRLWTRVGRYWFFYRPEPLPPVIIGVFFDMANIPARL